MRISDWSSDVCSSDLLGAQRGRFEAVGIVRLGISHHPLDEAVALAAVDGQAHRHLVLDDRTRHHGRELAVILVAAARLARRLEIERPEERRVGKESVSTCRSRWWPYT